MAGQTTITLPELLSLKADARGFSLSPRQPVSSLLSGRHASRLRGRGLQFEELRHYHAGDDIRTMDWKATARLRTPHVRVFTEERERPVLVVLDQRRSMFFGSRRAMKSVAAAELAALAAWRTLDGGDRVGGLVFNEEEIRFVKPHRSQARVLEFLHQVVCLNQKLATEHPQTGPEKVTLEQVMTQTAQIVKHDHLVVLISDLSGATDEMTNVVTRIAAHNDVLVAAVYDPLGASLVVTPGMLASDRDRVWDLGGDDQFTKRFQAAFERQLEHWRDVFRSLRIPVMPITTARPVAEQIRGLVGGRTFSP